MFERPALQPGKPRLGTVYFAPREAGRPAMVFDKGDEIELTVNYDHDDEIGRRFTGRTMTYGDDPTYELFDYSLPSQVWFADPHGVICLVEPHGRSSSFGGVQEGRLRFAYALIVGDVGVSYESINGMQSRIEGLNEWVRLSSVSHDYVTAFLTTRTARSEAASIWAKWALRRTAVPIAEPPSETVQISGRADRPGSQKIHPQALPERFLVRN